MTANNKKSNVKVNRIVTYKNKERIVETMIIDGKPTFIELNLDTNEISYLESIEIGGKKYFPLSEQNSFLSCGAFKLPTKLEEYGSKKTLLEEIRQFIMKFVDCSQEFLVMCSYYVLLTYFYPTFEEIPYLRVIGDYGSGKSRLLKTVGSISYNPIFMNGSASIASIFRVMDMTKGTFVFDEADIPKSDTSNALIKIFNNGYQKGMPVFRTEGDDFDPRAFDIYSPKIIGGRMEFADKATESRCLSEIMRTTKRTDIQSVGEDFEEEATQIRNKLLKFTFDTIKEFKPQSNQYELDGLEPRLKQVLRPLLSFIDDKSEGEMLINYMKKRQENLLTDRQMSLEGAIFEILSSYLLTNNTEKIHLSAICDLITDNMAYKYMTSRKIGSLLRQYGVDSFGRDAQGVYLDLQESREVIEETLVKFGFSEEKK